MKFDLAILGGGVIGLSIAYEFLKNSRSVCVIDRPMTRRSTSWAAAGILPAINPQTAVEPIDQLRARGDLLHRQWQRELLELTGIDNELRQVGTLFVARSAGEAASLSGIRALSSQEDLETEICDAARMDQLFPGILPPLSSKGIRKAVYVPGESTINTARHLAALRSAVEKLGGTLLKTEQTPELARVDDRLVRARVSVLGDSEVCSIDAGQFCFCAGSWTSQLLAQFQLATSTVPIRGQILMFQLPPEHPGFEPVIYEGSQYLVPRRDGHVLAGSTLEEAGFDDSTTPETLDRLLAFAEGWVPELNQHTIVDSWSGLRPGTYDSMPYLGMLPGIANGLVACGHFRSGIHMAPSTAELMFRLATEKPLGIDISSFAVSRG